MADEKVNLFIYGSLRDSKIFESVSGYSFSRRPSRVHEKTLFAEPAFLPGYRKVSPDNVYFYAIAVPSARIEGLIIHDVPVFAMTEIDRYEGKRYQRDTVTVNTAGGALVAQAYLASNESMRKHFGDRFHVNLIHELWLRKRIKQFISKHTRPGDRTADAELERVAERELLGTTERDLVMTHYRSDAVSDYFLERELDRPRPSMKHLYNDEQAKPFIRNYLALVIRQVILNQLDEKIQYQYRFELEHMRSSERYYLRSISLLAALRMINAVSGDIDNVITKYLNSVLGKNYDLIDYIKYAIRISHGIFDDRVAMANLERIRSNRQVGLVPLGFELEMSNLGPAAVEPQRSLRKAFDPAYDGFKYFNDFGMDVLFWKIGGYVDDHKGSTELGRRSGFLEIAPGRLNVAGELSRPATADPWLLNQMIHELVKFYDVKPHSLHLSFQLRKSQIGKQQILPLGFVKCLLGLGGGPELRSSGLWVSRMGQDEIMQHNVGEELVFARTSRRNWYLGGDDIANKAPAQATTYVQQYKFIRLDRRANYEPLIMGLKGLQLAFNPGDYLNAEQLKSSPAIRRQYRELKKWAYEPTQIAPQTIKKFLDAIHHGLMHEMHRQPAHQLHYIDWAISAIDVQLRMFNKQVRKAGPS
jgi:hypothetical protein